LIKYGITAGAAKAAFFDLGRRRYLATGSLTYVAVFPAWWVHLGSITRAYCAARFEHEDAQSVADALAIQKTLDRLRARLNTQLAHPAASAGGNEPATLQTEIDKVHALRDRLPLSQDDPDRIPNENEHNAAASVARESGWDMGKRGRCSPLQSIGVYAGIPSSFTASAQPTSADRDAAREFSPLVSFGVALTPLLSSVSVLIGPTVSHVATDSGGVVTAWSWSVSLGGNLDLLGHLVGGK
jgi:hypothetical protein